MGCMVPVTVAASAIALEAEHKPAGQPQSGMLLQTQPRLLLHCRSNRCGSKACRRNAPQRLQLQHLPTNIKQCTILEQRHTRGASSSTTQYPALTWTRLTCWPRPKVILFGCSLLLDAINSASSGGAAAGDNGSLGWCPCMLSSSCRLATVAVAQVMRVGACHQGRKG